MVTRPGLPFLTYRIINSRSSRTSRPFKGTSHDLTMILSFDTWSVGWESSRVTQSHLHPAGLARAIPGSFSGELRHAHRMRGMDRDSPPPQLFLLFASLYNILRPWVHPARECRRLFSAADLPVVTLPQDQYPPEADGPQSCKLLYLHLVAWRNVACQPRRAHHHDRDDGPTLTAMARRRTLAPWPQLLHRLQGHYYDSPISKPSTVAIA